MPWKKCQCGEPVLVPKKTDKKVVKCRECGAIALLKKRNGNRVRGLRFPFSKLSLSA